MRTKRRTMELVMALLATGAAAYVGCGTYYEDLYEPLTDPSLASDGGAGGTPSGCLPNENEGAVADACGVFVSASRGDDGGAGTKGAPMKSAQAAITRAVEKGAPRVYACAETFEESVELPGGVTIFGGLDCKDGWRWIGETTRTTVTAAEGVIPLRLRGGEGAARLEDVQVTARSIDADDPALRGASSIAVLAEIEVEMARCALEAGDGAPGAEGAAAGPDNAAGGAAGNMGNEACSANMIFGGGDQVNDCGTPGDASDDSIGGTGGIGQQSSGGDGTNGSPGVSQNRGSGEGVAVCTAGTQGDGGATGNPGAGASGIGAISSAGYAGVPGGDGTKGGPGQGGGGGGGSKGGTAVNQCMAGSAGGASGGSGGSGGCGGIGGQGGRPAGSSIGLVHLSAALTLEAVTIKTGRGGAGGQGGVGQTGGDGGAAGPGGEIGGASALNKGCSGGSGGNGGAGGLGGGGLGGHSIGIAYTGAVLSMEGVMIETGAAGLGGAGADADHNGAAGVKVDVRAFP